MDNVSLKQKIGERITRFFVIKDIEMRTKKTDNQPYLVLELGYDKGRIWSNIWENTEDFLEEYNTGDVVKIQGVLDQYKEQTQIKIDKIRKSVASDDVRPDEYLPSYSGDISILEKELSQSVKSIKNRHLNILCDSVLLKGDFSKRFCVAPGGKLWHHGYIGGLLEHTLAVTKICDIVAAHYDYINADLLHAAALLHDIGKADTYTITPYIDYTDEGRLTGHIVIGYEQVKNEIRSIEGFPEELSKQLLHLILSHQGELEKASPVVPMISEGIILHYADEIDSKLNAMKRIADDQKTDRNRWSNYVNLLDRFLYFGEADAE